jgi:hypothetical protein
LGKTSQLPDGCKKRALLALTSREMALFQLSVKHASTLDVIWQPDCSFGLGLTPCGLPATSNDCADNEPNGPGGVDDEDVIGVAWNNQKRRLSTAGVRHMPSDDIHRLTRELGFFVDGERDITKQNMLLVDIIKLLEIAKKGISKLLRECVPGKFVQ